MKAPSRLPVADAAHRSWRLPAPLRVGTRAFAEALFFTDQGPPPAARIDWVIDELEDYLAHSGPRAQMVFAASITAVSTLAPPFSGKARLLPMLTPEERAHAIERFEQTPLGLAVLGAKAMLCLIWYEHPEVRADVDIDSVCLKSRSNSGAKEQP